MSIIPDFNKPEIDEIAADMPPVYCQLSETTLQLCLHLLTRQPESESFWTLAGADFNDVLLDYVYLAQKELIDAMNPVARDIIFVPYKDVTETNTQDAIEQLEDIKEDIGAAAAVASDLADHESDTNNPHGVTAAQVGVEAGADVTDSTNVAAAGAVMTSGNQTLGGIKTFSSFPVTPSSAPTTDYQTANKKYVDDNAPTYYGIIAQLTTDYSSSGSTAWDTITSGSITVASGQILELNPQISLYAIRPSANDVIVRARININSINYYLNAARVGNSTGDKFNMFIGRRILIAGLSGTYTVYLQIRPYFTGTNVTLDVATSPDWYFAEVFGRVY